MDFTGKTAIVTGAGRGLGLSYASELARLGAHVLISDIGADSQGAAADASVALDAAQALAARQGGAGCVGQKPRFGAELDSLADSLSFGTAPAIIIFLWSLSAEPRIGWFAALAFAICCALRLARFNAQIDVSDQPHKSLGFLTGVPAPLGAGLAFAPFYLWMATGLLRLIQS